MKGSNPRGQVRSYVRIPGELASPGRRFPVMVTDVHVEGARLRTRKPLAKGDRVELSLSLPGARRLLVAAVVRWQRRSAAGGWSAGLVLKHTPGSRKVLLDLLWKLRLGEARGIEPRPRGSDPRR